jgi:hypothetical protein
MLDNQVSPFRFFHLGNWWWSLLLAAVITGIAIHAMSLPMGADPQDRHGWLLASAAFPFGIQALLITPSLLLEAEQCGVRRSAWLFGPLVLAGVCLAVVFICTMSS